MQPPFPAGLEGFCHRLNVFNQGGHAEGELKRGLFQRGSEGR
ncbi:hypothetical protein [Xenophilus sp. Marseille-Q4582]|nr:hypothetical protein [Xenophilus sp. Marseille-Q4582]